MMFRAFLALCLLLAQFNAAGALTPGQRAAVLNGGPAWFQKLTNQAGSKATQTCNFVKNQCWTGSTFVPAASALTVSRASPETCADTSGNYIQVTNGAPCITNAGLGAWEARTNSIRTSDMTGAVAGADNIEKLSVSGGVLASGNWTLVQPGASTVTFGAGTLSINSDGSNRAYATQQISGLTIGRSYVVSVDTTTGNTLPQVSVGTTSGGTEVVGYTAVQGNGQGGGTVSDRFAFTATQTSHWVSLTRLLAGTATFSSVSVMDGERVENGGFTNSPINAAQNTVQNGFQWSVGGGSATAVYSSGTVVLTADAANAANLDTNIPTVANVTYTITFDIPAGVSMFVLAGTTQGGGTLLNTATGTGTSIKKQFTASGASTWIRFTRTAGAGLTSTVDNVSVQSAGKLPNNAYSDTLPSWLIRTVTALPTMNGLNAISVRIQGTPTSTSTYSWGFEGLGQIAATYGQTWTGSILYALTGGSLTGTTSSNVTVDFRDTGLSAVGSSGAINYAAATSTPVRGQASFTPVGPTVAWVSMLQRVGYSNGVAIDYTMTWAGPQLENNNINSSVASAALATGGAVTGVSRTMYVYDANTATQSANVSATVSGGAVTAVSLSTAGSYSTLPAPGSLVDTVFQGSISGTTLTVSGTFLGSVAIGQVLSLNEGSSVTAGTVITGGSGTTWTVNNSQTIPSRTFGGTNGTTAPTVTLTPTNNAALGFATPPIVTTSGAVARAANNTRPATAPAYGPSWTIFTAGTPTAPVGVTQFLFQVGDGTNAARTSLRRSSLGVAQSVLAVASAENNAVGSTAWTTGSPGRIAASFSAGASANSFNGGVVGTGGATLPAAPTSGNVGADAGALPLNGPITSYAIWSNGALPNATLPGLNINYLLRRDLGPANDNSPMYLDAAA